MACEQRVRLSGSVTGLRNVLWVLIAVGALVAVPAASGSGLVPDGYHSSDPRTLVRGVHVYGAARPGVERVNVARLETDAAVRFTAGLGLDRVIAAEPTSSMCRRANCLIGVNADYFDIHTKQPVGGVVRDGELVRSPKDGHPQFTVTASGAWTAEPLGWSARVSAERPASTPVPLDPTSIDPTRLPTSSPEPDDFPEPVAISGVNVPPVADGVVVYTPNWYPTTATPEGHTEMVVGLAAPIAAEGSRDLDPRSIGANDTEIPRDGAVLSGHGKGATALRRLWDAVRSGSASGLRLASETSPDGVQTSIGGGPVLVKSGEMGSFERAGRHPRTLIGWEPGGRRWLVTVDGRQPGHSRGMTLEEAAAFMLRLGATEVLNLDGGGSTTFVEQGHVVNRPIHGNIRGRERSVANALLAIATGPLIEDPAPEPPPAPASTPSPRPEPAAVGSPPTPVPATPTPDRLAVAQGSPERSFAPPHRKPVDAARVFATIALIGAGAAIVGRRRSGRSLRSIVESVVRRER